MPRANNRQPGEMRPVSITRNFTRHAEGSVLICFGDTKVICTATLEERVPHFLRKSGKGWVTAEYGMLPRSTHDRMAREAARGQQSGRTMEIQRLIGRSLRAALDMKQLGERTITLDCDVIQADGGTRTAAITGAYVAMADAISALFEQKRLSKFKSPIVRAIASVSVGIFQGQVITDLDYPEDSKAQTDMNVVMDDSGGLIEVQGTAEAAPFSRESMNEMLDHASVACDSLFAAQRQALQTLQD